jgi:hypothetical protein
MDGVSYRTDKSRHVLARNSTLDGETACCVKPSGHGHLSKKISPMNEFIVNTARCQQVPYTRDEPANEEDRNAQQQAGAETADLKARSEDASFGHADRYQGAYTRSTSRSSRSVKR